MPLPTSYSWVLSTVTGSAPLRAGRGNAGNRTTGEGKTGIAFPFSSDGRGRLALTSGDNQLEKIILLNLNDCESANPFQDELGLGADMVFAVSSEKLRTEVRRRINQLFRRLQLQDRGRLIGLPNFTTDSANQELTVDIEYMNLEENKPGSLGLKFSLRDSAGA